MAAKLEEKMLQDTFTKWFDTRLDKAVATTEEFAKRTDATPATIQREVNNQVHESMKSALTDSRVVEKRLYQDVDKTMEVSVDNIAKRWNDEYANLFKQHVKI